MSSAGAAPLAARQITLQQRAGGVLAARFLAMGSPCEVLAAGSAPDAAMARARSCAAEAWRIERKFSRYRSDSIVHAINSARGRPVAVDAETEGLLEFAARCHALSEGRFDITCGALRRR